MMSPSPGNYSATRRMFSILPLIPLGALTFTAVAQPADGEAALACLHELVLAYSEGRLESAQALVAPQMIGYSRLVSALREASADKKQFLVTLPETSVLASTDVVVVQARWEKRFLALPGLAPRQANGRATFVMRRQDGVWRLLAVDGDNLFTSR